VKRGFIYCLHPRLELRPNFSLAGLRRGGQIGNVKFKGAAKGYGRYGFRRAIGTTNPS